MSPGRFYQSATVVARGIYVDALTFLFRFYEVRAYTKYMLNFGEATVFSRIFPVFDKPDSEGDYTQKEICRHPGKYPQKREKNQERKETESPLFILRAER